MARTPPLEDAESLQPLFAGSPVDRVPAWRRRFAPLLAAAVLLGAGAVAGTRWARQSAADGGQGAPLRAATLAEVEQLSEAAEAGCLVELFEQAGFAGASATFGVGPHPAPRQARSMAVRGRCTALLSADAGFALPWHAYPEGRYDVQQLAAPGREGEWPRSLVVMPGPLAPPDCMLEVPEQGVLGVEPVGGQALSVGALRRFFAMGSSSLQVHGDCAPAYQGEASFSLRLPSLSDINRSLSTPIADVPESPEVAVPSLIVSANTLLLREPIARHASPSIVLAGPEDQLSLALGQDMIAAPGCAVDLYEYDGSRLWNASLGVGLHLGGELVGKGFRVGISSLQVHGGCVAVLSEHADFSLPWSYHTSHSFDLKALRVQPAPDDRVGSVLLLPGAARPSVVGGQGSGAQPASGSGALRGDSIPRVVYVTSWMQSMTGELLETWTANVKFLPPGTQVRYFNDAQMARSAREISGALSRAGVVHGAYEAFKSLRPMAYRADLFRYMLLWKYGGMYFDHKMKLVSPVEDWIDLDAGPALWLVQDVGPPGFYNAVMAATPRSSLLELVIQHVVNSVLLHAYPKNSLQLTGPHAIAEALGIYDVKGVKGNWSFGGFRNAGKGLAPKVFARLDIKSGLRVMSLKPEDPERVLAIVWQPLHSSVYSVLFYKHMVYCDEPGDPCPPA